jgi:hypothetical protein
MYVTKNSQLRYLQNTFAIYYRESNNAKLQIHLNTKHLSFPANPSNLIYYNKDTTEKALIGKFFDFIENTENYRYQSPLFKYLITYFNEKLFY